MPTNITREALDKQINRNRILSLILLFVVIAGFAAAAYYYHKATTAEKTIDAQNQVIETKDEKLVSQNLLIAEQKKTLEAVQLLKVFLDDNNEDKVYTTDDILSHLSELAKEKTDEIEKRNTARKAEITKLFNKNSDATRKAAQNTISRNYSNDKKLIPDLLHFALDNRVDSAYSGSIYRTIDILRELSSAALIENEKLVNEFLGAALGINIGAPGTETGKEVQQIKKKMRV